MKFLLGRKVGMTQIYDDKGVSRAVTIIEAQPNTITQIKNQEQDGYQALQLGFGTRRRVTKPLAGHLKASGAGAVAAVREVRLDDPSDQSATFTLGQKVDVTMFQSGDQVSVAAISKGKGYAGVVKRHGFAGGPGSHGSDFHRAPGAIGGRWPQRVVKGRRMAGHLGATRVTVKNVTVLQVDHEQNLLVVSGALPGPRRGLVEISGKAQ